MNKIILTKPLIYLLCNSLFLEIFRIPSQFMTLKEAIIALLNYMGLISDILDALLPKALNWI